MKSGGSVDANLTAVAGVASLATAVGLGSHRGSDAPTRGPVAMIVVTDVPKHANNGAMAVASIHVALAVDRSHGASSAEETIPRWHAQSVGRMVLRLVKRPFRGLCSGCRRSGTFSTFSEIWWC